MKAILGGLLTFILLSFTGLFKKDTAAMKVDEGYSTLAEYEYQTKKKEAEYLEAKGNLIASQIRLEEKFKIKK